MKGKWSFRYLLRISERHPTKIHKWLSFQDRDQNPWQQYCYKVGLLLWKSVESSERLLKESLWFVGRSRLWTIFPRGSVLQDLVLLFCNWGTQRRAAHIYLQKSQQPVQTLFSRSQARLQDYLIAQVAQTRAQSAVLAWLRRRHRLSPVHFTVHALILVRWWASNIFCVHLPFQLPGLDRANEPDWIKAS